MLPALVLATLEAPQVPSEHGAAHSLEGTRRQVEERVAILLASQVPPVFEGLFGGEGQVAPRWFPLERLLGDILHISHPLYPMCIFFCLRLANWFLPFKELSSSCHSSNGHGRV